MLKMLWWTQSRQGLASLSTSLQICHQSCQRFLLQHGIGPAFTLSTNASVASSKKSASGKVRPSSNIEVQKGKREKSKKLPKLASVNLQQLVHPGLDGIPNPKDDFLSGGKRGYQAERHPSQIKLMNSLKSIPLYDQIDQCQVGRKPKVRATVDAWLRLTDPGQEVDWQNPKVVQFVEHACGLLNKANWEELKRFLRGILWARTKPPLLYKFKTALAVECTNKLVAKGKKGGILLSDKQRKDVFIVAELWYKLSKSMADSDDTEKCRFECGYTRQLVQLFWLDKDLLMGLTPREFSVLCFLTNLHREFPTKEDPGGRRENQEYEFPLPLHVAEKIRSVLGVLSLKELGNICNMLYIRGAMLHKDSKQLNSDLLMLVRDVSADEIVREQPAVSGLLKLLHETGGCHDEGLMQEVVDKYVPLFKDLDHMTRLRLVLMTINTNIKSYNNMLKELVKNTVKDFHRLRSKDMSQFAFILHWYNYSGPSVLLQDTLAVALDRRDLRSHPKDGYHLVLLAGYLTKARILQPQLVSELFEKANSFEKFWSDNSRNEQNLLEATIEWTINLTHATSKQDLSQYVKQQWSNSNFYKYALFNLAEMDCNIELDFPAYDGPRLDERLRSRFLPLGRHKYSYTEEKLFKKVAQKLEDLFGNYVYQKRLMPHVSHRDIVLCLDKDLKHGVPLKMKVMEKMLQEMIKAHLLVDFDRELVVPLAVVVPKIEHLDSRGHPLGPISHKIRQLEALGYTVVLVNPIKFDAARKKKAEYLEKLIDEKVRSSKREILHISDITSKK